MVDLRCGLAEGMGDGGKWLFSFLLEPRILHMAFFVIIVVRCAKLMSMVSSIFTLLNIVVDPTDGTNSRVNGASVITALSGSYSISPDKSAYPE